MAAEEPHLGWSKDLFIAFCEERLLLQPNTIVRTRVARAAAFFGDLEKRIPHRVNFDAHALHRAFTAEELRLTQSAVAFLEERFTATLSPEERLQIKEERLIEQLLANASAHLWGNDLREFDRALREASRPLAARSRRSYLAAAMGLLKHASRDRIQDLAQDDVDGYLRRRPGQCASLSPLVSWIEKRHALKLTCPAKRKRDDAAREKKLLVDVDAIMRALEASENASSARALLAAAISLLYRLPLEHVVALQATDVEIGDNVVLWPATGAIQLDDRVGLVFRKWLGRTEAGPMFPGRNKTRPMSVDVVRYQVSALNSAN